MLTFVRLLPYNGRPIEAVKSQNIYIMLYGSVYTFTDVVINRSMRSRGNIVLTVVMTSLGCATFGFDITSSGQFTFVPFS